MTERKEYPAGWEEIYGQRETTSGAGGFLVPEHFLTGRWEDKSGRVRRAFVQLGLAKPRMVWRGGLFDAAPPQGG